MMRNLDTTLVRAFVAVAETASMTAAANMLNLTQAAVSQQIKRLEEAFDCTLFGRDRRGMRLTDEGERLFGKAKRLLALNDEIWADMTTPAFTGKVRFGIPYDLVGPYLPPILRSFSTAYPNVEISLVCLNSADLATALAAGEVDLAVIEQRTDRATGECLATDRLVWVGARGGDAFRKRPLPISCMSDTCAFRPVAFDALRRASLPWRIVSEVGNLDAISATVQTDLAIMPLLSTTIPPGLDVLGSGSGLPELPIFAISLHMPVSGGSDIARALAQRIRDGFIRPQRQAA